MRLERDIGGEPGDKVPGLLRTAGDGGRGAQFVACEESTDIDLAGRSLGQLVIAVAGHPVPLVAEVMVDAGHKKVVLLGELRLAL